MLMRAEASSSGKAIQATLKQRRCEAMPVIAPYTVYRARKGMCNRAGEGAHREGALALALGAGVGLHFAIRVLEEGAQHIAALHAVELDLLQLREHVGAARHHPGCVHHLVQVLLPATPHLLVTPDKCNVVTPDTSCCSNARNAIAAKPRGAHLFLNAQS